MKDIKTITPQSFAPYGTVVAHDPARPEGFQVVVAEKDAPGWNLAVSKVTARAFRKLARHPNTRESFEPLAGVTLLVVAPPDKPAQFEAFLLDRPICLFKSVWHVTVTLSDWSMVKITENAVVDSEDFHLDREHRPAVG